ncbi:MAG: hypothetical protein IJT58_06070 [Synergistaceae bacterium]|nr:hypothetical protein [Synergistaceae bacterium]
MTNKEELSRLIEIAEKDKEFAEKFIAAEKAKDADEIIRLAAEKGVTLKRENSLRHEIDNEELKNVTGGSEKFVHQHSRYDRLRSCIWHRLLGT